ncbi:hypothetical protein B0H13DRAFT_2316671 [Mycena leptocephala]|nr:hypothetical protein B0H13DRAFT_2316671 [Mycena leptocephala]
MSFRKKAKVGKACSPAHPPSIPGGHPNGSSSDDDDDIAPSKAVDLFRRNCTAEKAHLWLRTLEQAFKWNSDEKEKLYNFETGLHPAGQAEEWWSNLEQGKRESWAALMKAFETKWPKPKPAVRPQELVLDEVMANTLDISDVGQFVTDDNGEKIASHVAWAPAMRKLLADIPGGDTSMLLRRTVRETLPVAFRRLINEAGLDIWEKWLAAVEGISMDTIKDLVEECSMHDVPRMLHKAK